MKRLLALSAAIWISAALVTAPHAQEPEAAEPGAEAPGVHWLLTRTQLEALWYLHYRAGEEGGSDYNGFSVGRGYSTFKFRPVEWLAARSTVDAYQGDDGWEVRLKYLFGQLLWPLETSVISRPRVEFGVVHIPWLGYEESINRYRLQGTMFLERNGIFNSADLGVTAVALLGEPLPDSWCEEIDCHYPGSWGSLSAGVYNGAGYHDPELNEDKVVMARLSVRPAGPWLPNLSLSYFVLFGAGAAEAEPDWQVHSGFASFEHEYFVVTGQAATGEGTQAGDRVDPDGSAQPFVGASGFAEIKVPSLDTALFGRFDWFRWETAAGDDIRARTLAGLAYFFYRDCAVVLDYDRLMFWERGGPDDWAAKLTMQVWLH